MRYVEKYVGGIREKMTAIVNSGLDGDEKLLAWSISWMYPSILAWIPVVSNMDFLKKCG
jgi:hypothetical protein